VHDAYLLQRGAVGMAIQTGPVPGGNEAIVAVKLAPGSRPPLGGWPTYTEQSNGGTLTAIGRCAGADYPRLAGAAGVLSGPVPVTGRCCSGAPRTAAVLSPAIVAQLGIVPPPEPPRGDLPAGGSEPAAGVPQARGSAAATDADAEDWLEDDGDDAPPMVVATFFTDHAATTKREQSLTLEALAERIHTTAASDKARLPWLKLARFGERRTDKGSLRHNDNIFAITGLEADYDRGEMSLAEAKDVIATGGICTILYPSPSYTPATPKWRVLCPFSQEYPPEARDRFMARLNGLFGGIFSRESWVLSQSYYFGRVANPDHHAIVFEGTPIDLADHLDAGAIGRPKERNVGQQPAPQSRPEHITEARIRGLVTSLLDNIRAAKDGEKHHTLRDICLTLGGYLHLVGWSVDEAVEQAIGALPSADDWDQARDTARWAITRGMQRSLDLEDRPGGRGHSGGGRAHGGPQPEPDPEPEPGPEPDPPPPSADAELPDLFVMKADLPLVSQQLRDRLASHPWLFERGGPARLTCYPPAEARPAEINMLGVEGTAHAAHEVCRPYLVDPRGKRNNVTLPERVAKLYLALNGRWHLRPLHGICGSVLLDNDGGIHAHEGYHAPSGMWCTQAPPLTVPDRPAKDEAVDALYRLRAAMRTFTFKGSLLTRIDGIAADVVDIEQKPGPCESAALCGLLTAVCRASLPLAPGVMINAPSVSGSGAGKSLLARMIVAIAFGVIAKAGTAGHDEQELEKRIAASLLRGEPVLLLDNLNNTLLRSAQLESCLTEPLVSVRLFGKLTMQDVRCTAFVVVTGNGLQASGDTARRFVYATLEPPVDNPEQREYPAGFLDSILARRGELLADCLTIWRWGRQQSGLKRGLPFGSYERWATWVRDPLLALGCDDPVKGVQDARDRDPHRVNITALFAEWRVWHGSDWTKADDLNPAVRRLIDDKERVPAIRQKLSQLASTRLGGSMLECKVAGNAANRVSLYRVVAITAVF
jgi:hypothetical protein